MLNMGSIEVKYIDKENCIRDLCKDFFKSFLPFLLNLNQCASSALFKLLTDLLKGKLRGCFHTKLCMYYLPFLMWQKLIDDVVSNFAHCSTYIPNEEKKNGVKWVCKQILSNVAWHSPFHIAHYLLQGLLKYQVVWRIVVIFYLLKRQSNDDL